MWSGKPAFPPIGPVQYAVSHPVPRSLPLCRTPSRPPCRTPSTVSQPVPSTVSHPVHQVAPRPPGRTTLRRTPSRAPCLLLLQVRRAGCAGKRAVAVPTQKGISTGRLVLHSTPCPILVAAVDHRHELFRRGLSMHSLSPPCLPLSLRRPGWTTALSLPFRLSFFSLSLSPPLANLQAFLAPHPFVSCPTPGGGGGRPLPGALPHGGGVPHVPRGIPGRSHECEGYTQRIVQHSIINPVDIIHQGSQSGSHGGGVPHVPRGVPGAGSSQRRVA
jgi:hypothetical protein